MLKYVGYIELNKIWINHTYFLYYFPSATRKSDVNMWLTLYSFWTKLVYTMKKQILRTDLKKESGTSLHSLVGSWRQVGANIEEWATECLHRHLCPSRASQQQVHSGLGWALPWPLAHQAIVVTIEMINIPKNWTWGSGDGEIYQRERGNQAYPERKPVSVVCWGWGGAWAPIPGQEREGGAAQAGVCTGLSGPSSLTARPTPLLATTPHLPLPIHHKFPISFPRSDNLTLRPA